MCHEAARPWALGYSWHWLTEGRRLQGEHLPLSELSPGYASSRTVGMWDTLPAGLLGSLESILGRIQEHPVLPGSSHPPFQVGWSFVSEALG